MEKDLDQWNKAKKEIDKKVISRDFFFHEREVWWGSLGLNIGVESNGKGHFFERPILIIKVFNTDMVWCLPMTSTLRNNSQFYYKVKVGEDFRSVLTTQIRTISSKRLLRKVGTVDETDFAETLKVVCDFLIK
jgi:mRNA-degrading endonuclease toxin of MazEF toxin-antitoxin module